jgi:tetratricopeptide (TPR) repeat protein
MIRRAINRVTSVPRRLTLVTACAAIVLCVALPYSLSASAQPADPTDPTRPEASPSFRYKPDDSVLQALTEEQALDLLRQLLRAKLLTADYVEGEVESLPVQFLFGTTPVLSFKGAWHIAQVTVLDDRIKLRFSRQDRKEKEFLYHELAAIETAYEPGVFRTVSYVSLNTEFALLPDIYIRSSFESKFMFLKKLADALYVLKRSAEGASPERDRKFAEVAAQYRASVEKPESAVREERLADAVRLYQSALKIVPWWPEGRFNRSLVLAETNRYGEAIAEMKRYLTLVPDAPNARAAQDKIYEWEGKLAPVQR